MRVLVIRPRVNISNEALKQIRDEAISEARSGVIVIPNNYEYEFGEIDGVKVVNPADCLCVTEGNNGRW